MKRLVALRHGQSEYNLRGLCNDDDAAAVALTVDGERQARHAARLLAAERFDVVYCSPLLRTRQTAGIMATALSLDVVIEPRLADIRSGFDGRPVAAYLAAIADDPVDARPAGGESLRGYACRVAGFLDELAEDPGGDVLLIVHEETLRVIDARCNRKPLQTVVGRAFANCRPYRFQLSSEKR